MHISFFSVAILAIGLLSPLTAQSVYKVDATHSEVGFRVRHLVSRVPGQFRAFEGTVQIDEKHLDRSSVTFSIQAASIDTHLEARDKHLRGIDFFDTEHYPLITFRSTKIVDRGQGHLDVYGDLSIRGISKPITIASTSLGSVETPFKDTRAGFEGTVKVNRKDFGMTWNLPLNLGGTVLGDEVDITLALEAIKHEAK